MGWATTLRALRRRWYVAVAGLLVTVGLGFGAIAVTPPSYQVAGTVLLMPSTLETEQAGNPFLGLGSLSATGLILATRLNSDQEVARIAELAPTAEYHVGPDPILGEPALLVTVWDETPQGALDVLDTLIAEIPGALEQLQEEVEVPAEAVIGSIPLTRALEPEKVTKATQRALVAAVGGGLALTVGAAVGLDAFLRRRRRGTTSAGAPDANSSDRRGSDGGSDGDAVADPLLRAGSDTATPTRQQIGPVIEPLPGTAARAARAPLAGAKRRHASGSRVTPPSGPPSFPPAESSVSLVQWPPSR